MDDTSKHVWGSFPAGWPIGEAEREADEIFAAIRTRTQIDCAIPGRARAVLIASGIYRESGELSPEFGGPDDEASRR